MIKVLASKHSYLGILLIGAVLFFQNASTPGFFHDGYLYAALGKNAVLTGQWLVPFLSETNYPVFAEHPPFLFILEGLFFKVFGFDFLQARFFSGLWGILVLLMLAKMAERHLGKGAGFFAGFALLLMPFFIKKVRFPNLDIPLTFFILASAYFFIQAYERKRWADWIGCGAFFGLGLLTKGPPALFLPLSFLIFFFLKRDLVELKSIRPWVGMLLGLALFLVWPLSLWLSDQSPVFWMWWQRQITGTIVEGRETKQLNIFTYFIDLLKIMPIHWIAMILLLRFKKIDFKNNAVLISVVFFLTYLLAISFMKFKYSHYLLPILPFGALIVANAAKIISEHGQWRFQQVLYVAGVLILVASFILPFGKEVKRDRFLVEITKKVESENVEFKKILLHPNAYEYWAATNYFAYIHQANVIGFNWDTTTSDDQLLKMRQDYNAGLVSLGDVARFSALGPITEIHRDSERQIAFILFQ